MSAIKQAIFTVESLAHLRGKEHELLPIVDAARAEYEELVRTLDRCVHYLADLNGSNWIKGDSVGELDMRQRAKALQSIAYSVSAKAKGETK